LVNDQWEYSIVGAKTRSLELENSGDPAKKVRAIAVRGVDGSGALSPASILAIE
jgi:hypothetical protein